MQQWEYKVIQSRGGSSDLNEVGKDGWELVFVVDNGNSLMPICYFKRPLSNADKIFNEVKNEVEGLGPAPDRNFIP